MGLLDDLLAGLNQGTADQSVRQPRNAPAQSAGGGMSNAMMALLPVVLAMLSNRGAGRSPMAQNQRPGAQMGGGLGDVIGAIFGTQAGGSGNAGLGELLNQLQRAGFGGQAESWVSRNQNLPLPADAMEQVFGRRGLTEIARRAGLSETETTQGLSQLLPEVVDHVTPEGRVPDFDALTASVDALSKRFGLA
jgi:uncharacterized protein YidB (DUF937 family)